LALNGNASFDLGADGLGGIAGTRDESGEGHGFAFGMEDHALGAAFDINGPAIFAAAAVIGHHRKRLLLALPRRFQVFEHLLHLQQIESHAPQRLIRFLRLTFVLFGAGAKCSQELLLGLEPAALVLGLAAQLRGGVLLVVQTGGDSLQFFADFSHLQLHLNLFAGQFFMQSVAFLLPLFAGLFFEPFALGLMGRFVSRTVLGQLGGFALRSGLGGLMGLAIHNQQDQDQRSHRAQQHGQEGERRNLQFVPASSHAAFPD
jgi:hypothetical protein